MGDNSGMCGRLSLPAEPLPKIMSEIIRDLENRDDIDLLMRRFYERAMADDVIGFIFTDVAMLDLDHHLPVIGDFWETIVFQTPVYARHGLNPL